MQQTDTAVCSYSMLEALPVEILVEIYSCLPSSGSVAALGMASKFMHAVLLRHEGFIARAIAAMMIDDDNPAAVKLAFMAAEVRFTNCRSPEAVKKFSETFVHHKQWPQNLYRPRALPIIQSIHDALVEFVEWCWSWVELPLVNTPREMSRMEAARQRRYGYILEAGYSLLHPLPPDHPSPDLDSNSALKLSFGEDVPSRQLIELSARF